MQGANPGCLLLVFRHAKGCLGKCGPVEPRLSTRHALEVTSRGRARRLPPLEGRAHVRQP